jgi:hypothetical protein
VAAAAVHWQVTYHAVHWQVTYHGHPERAVAGRTPERKYLRYNALPLATALSAAAVPFASLAPLPQASIATASPALKSAPKP